MPTVDLGPCECCGGGTGTGPCIACPIQLPARLYLSVSGGGCVNGLVIPMDFKISPFGGGIWQGQIGTPCTGTTFKDPCVGTTGTPVTNCCGVPAYAAAGMSCRGPTQFPPTPMGVLLTINVTPVLCHGTCPGCGLVGCEQCVNMQLVSADLGNVIPRCDPFLAVYPTRWYESTQDPYGCRWGLCLSNVPMTLTVTT
jgi:hypothetical protein